MCAPRRPVPARSSTRPGRISPPPPSASATISENLATTTAQSRPAHDRASRRPRPVPARQPARDGAPAARQPPGRAGIPRVVAQPQGRSLTTACTSRVTAAWRFPDEAQGADPCRRLAGARRLRQSAREHGAGAAVLRAAAAAARRVGPGGHAVAGSLLVQRPEAGPGLDSERIALLRSDQRFDFYAASRWAAPAPDLVEKRAGRPVARHRHVLRGVRRFLARMRRATTCAAECGASRRTTPPAADAPTVQVALDCTFGRHRDRTLLASFTAQGSAAATEDRLGAVVAALRIGDCHGACRGGTPGRRGAAAPNGPPSAGRTRKCDSPVASMRR